MGGLLHLVQRGGTGSSLPSPLLSVPNRTAHPSTASVPMTALLCNGQLLCGTIKGKLAYYFKRLFHYFLKSRLQWVMSGAERVVNMYRAERLLQWMRRTQQRGNEIVSHAENLHVYLRHTHTHTNWLSLQPQPLPSQTDTQTHAASTTASLSYFHARLLHYHNLWSPIVYWLNIAVVYMQHWTQ